MKPTGRKCYRKTTQVYQALPFVITAIVLVATSVRNKQGSGLPASLGVNYFREER